MTGQKTNKILLTQNQVRCAYLAQIMADSAALNVARAYRLPHFVDKTHHEELICRLARYDALPITLGDSPDGYTAQRLTDDALFVAWDRGRLEGESMERAFRDFARRPFDLSVGPLLRIRLVDDNNGQTVVFLAAHQLVADTRSLDTIVCELFGGVVGNNNGSPFAKFVQWQQQLIGDRESQMLADYRAAIGDVLPALDLPFDYPRPAMQQFAGRQQRILCPDDVTLRLSALARSGGTTLSNVVLAAWAVFLSRHCRQRDIAVGVSVDHRPLAELRDCVGPCSDVLVLRLDVDLSVPFEQWLRSVDERCDAARAYAALPFNTLLEALEPPRDLSRTPLYQAAYSFERQADPQDDQDREKPIGLLLDDGLVSTDVELHTCQQGSALVLNLRFCEALFERATMAAWSERFVTLLTSLANNPGQPIATAELIPAAELGRLLDQWNQTAKTISRSTTLPELVGHQATLSPEKVALRCGESSMTYGQLDARAHQWAAHFLQSGVEAGKLIGVLLTRSCEMVALLLGIHRAGAGYVPIDSAFPLARILTIIEDADLQLLVTDVQTSQLVDANVVQQCLIEDLPSDAPAAYSSVSVQPGDTAYAIYTSGSTGKPKGVSVTHGNVVNFLTSMKKKPGIDQSDVLLAVTTLSFDIAVLELFLPLIAGAAVVIASRETASDAQRLAALVEQQAVTFMQATPATWRLLLSTDWTPLRSFKILCGGEAMPRDLLSRLLQRVDVVWNMYGPTETTVWSTCHAISDPAAPILVGRPIDNTVLYIVDDNLNPVPTGVPGELIIGGAGVAAGYLNRPQLTAEKFIADPFRSGGAARVYRTGDLARYRLDGNLEHIGRLDNQVKVRGFRIELGEVEAALSQYPSVAQCVATVVYISASDIRLAAYYVLKSAQNVTQTELRRHLKSSLPDYMVPQNFVELSSLPLNANGKVDRSALPTPFADSSRPAFVEPSSPAERSLAAYWASALQRENISAHDNFFELGGHSLLAMTVIAQIRQDTGVNISPRDILMNSLAQLASQFPKLGGERQSSGVGTSVAIDRVSRINRVMRGVRKRWSKN